MKNERLKQTWLKTKKLIYLSFKIFFVILAISMSIDIYFELNYLRFERATCENVNELNPKTAAIVLGAAVYGTKPSAILTDRLKCALKLYKTKKVKKIILTGDNGKKYYNELTPMLRFMLKNKVKKDDIFMDYEGFRTYDSIHRAKVLFAVSDAIIVTQKFHQPRAAFIADSLGVNVSCLESDLRNYKDDSKNRFREYFARNLAWLDVFFTEPIPDRDAKYPIEKSGKKTWKERDLDIGKPQPRILDSKNL
jgi:SanA protein